jgi:hypothetical protein
MEHCVVTCDFLTTEITKGTDVTVKISPWAVPTVCQNEPMIDWLNSISSVLKWNQPIRVALPSDESEQTIISGQSLGSFMDKKDLGDDVD